MEITDLIGLGDDPALNFLNSTATPLRDTIELLGDGRSYLSWLQHAGLLDTLDKDAVLARFSAAELDTVATNAITLREWLRPVIAAWATAPDPALPADVQDHLNDILAIDHRFAQIHATPDGACDIHQRRHWHDARQLLVPPAHAAAQLLTAADRALVRHCEGPTCTLWFYDRTKAHRRRWCSMAICGNRAKARNHRKREHARTD